MLLCLCGALHRRCHGLDTVDTGFNRCLGAIAAHSVDQPVLSLILIDENEPFRPLRSLGTVSSVNLLG